MAFFVVLCVEVSREPPVTEGVYNQREWQDVQGPPQVETRRSQSTLPGPIMDGGHP